MRPVSTFFDIQLSNSRFGHFLKVVYKDAVIIRGLWIKLRKLKSNKGVIVEKWGNI